MDIFRASYGGPLFAAILGFGGACLAASCSSPDTAGASNAGPGGFGGTSASGGGTAAGGATTAGNGGFSADASVDAYTGPPGLTCGQILKCDQACGSNSSCTDGCYGKATAIAQGLFNDFTGCLNSQCAGSDAADCDVAAATGPCINGLLACNKGS